MPKKTYPKGRWLGIGIAIGLPIGMVLFFVAALQTSSSGRRLREDQRDKNHYLNMRACH